MPRPCSRPRPATADTVAAGPGAGRRGRGPASCGSSPTTRKVEPLQVFDVIGSVVAHAAVRCQGAEPAAHRARQRPPGRAARDRGAVPRCWSTPAAACRTRPSTAPSRSSAAQLAEVVAALEKRFAPQAQRACRDPARADRRHPRGGRRRGAGHLGARPPSTNESWR